MRAWLRQALILSPGKEDRGMNASREMRSLIDAGVRFDQVPFENLFKEWAARQGSTVSNKPSESAYLVTMI